MWELIRANKRKSVFLFITMGLVLLLLGFVAGSIMEKAHYQSIKEREKKTLHLPVVNMKDVEKILSPGQTVLSAQLVSGCVVISIDYFDSR